MNKSTIKHIASKVDADMKNVINMCKALNPDTDCAMMKEAANLKTDVNKYIDISNRLFGVGCGLWTVK